MLNRQLFVWNANDFCQRFKDRTTYFVQEWNVSVSDISPSIPFQADETPPAKRACLGKESDEN